MPSTAAVKFIHRVVDLKHLRALAVDKRIKPIDEKQKQIYLHSYLTGLVAAWDTYVKSVVKEFLSLISVSSDSRYTAVYSLLNSYVIANSEKLNTPNAENVRNFLAATTGYDPISDWVWSVRGLNGHATRGRLNEVLKVRHSFAHGFSMPSYDWNRSSTGKVRLTMSSVDDVKELLTFLTKKCDKGLADMLARVYGIRTNW